MKKGLIAFVFASSLVFLTSAYAQSRVNVEFNGLLVEFDQPAIIADNRTMVPVRKIFELLGATVTWDAEARCAKAELSGKKVEITIGEKEITVDGVKREIDAPARIVGNRTLVPLRAISESYDCKVGWDAKSATAMVFSDWYVSSEKLSWSDDYINLEYVFDCTPTAVDGGVSIRSNSCTLSVTSEECLEVTVNDKYIEDLKNGLKKFSGLELLHIEKIEGKNAVIFSVENKERTIYYVYAQKDGRAYNLALTVPVGAERIDAEKLRFSQKYFIENF